MNEDTWDAIYHLQRQLNNLRRELATIQHQPPAERPVKCVGSGAVRAPAGGFGGLGSPPKTTTSATSMERSHHDI